MSFDYSDAPPPRDFELIPHNTIATVSIHIRPGAAGENGMLKRSKDGKCEMLDIEFSVLDGQYKKRHIWENWVVEGTTDGHAKAIEISRSRIKAVLDSAFSLHPNDISPKARATRTVGYKQLEGLTFIARIGIEKGTAKNDGSGENWLDKNVIAAIITPDKPDWHPVEQPPPFHGGGPATSAAPSGAAPSTSTSPIARPGWAS